jgi:hypothetical protein
LIVLNRTKNKRIDKTPKAVASSIISGIVGKQIRLEQKPKPKPKPIYNSKVYAKPLTQNQQKRLIDFMVAYVKRLPDYIELDTMVDNYELSKIIDFCFCKNCGKENRLVKDFTFRGFCRFCNLDTLGLGSYRKRFFYLNSFKRFCYNEKTAKIEYQVEIVSGKYGRGWKAVFSGFATKAKIQT